MPLLVAGAAFVLFTGLARRRELPPFLAALALFVLSYIGLGISFYPYIVPPSITIWEAAAPDTSLALPAGRRRGADPADPAYTAWSYWVFRGKVDPAAAIIEPGGHPRPAAGLVLRPVACRRGGRERCRGNLALALVP